MAPRRETPERTTRMQTSHMVARICASVTNPTGGESITTVSNSLVISESTSRIRTLSMRSAGFGGTLPPVSSEREPSPEPRVASSHGLCVASTSDKPGSRPIPNTLCVDARRMSASTSNTLLPPPAIASAMFAAMVVLPSPGLPDVTRIVRIGLSGLTYLRLVRSVRNDSDPIARLSPTATSSPDITPGIPSMGESFPPDIGTMANRGTTPITGNPAARSASSGLRILSCNRSKRNAATTQNMSPSTSPITAFTLFFGLIGYVGTNAWSTICTFP